MADKDQTQSIYCVGENSNKSGNDAKFTRTDKKKKVQSLKKQETGGLRSILMVESLKPSVNLVVVGD